MRSLRQARRLLPIGSAPLSRPQTTVPCSNGFHSTATRPGRRRPRFPSISASALGLVKPTGASDALQPGSGSAFVEAQRAAAAAANKAARDADREAALKQYPPSTPEQLAELASRYSPAQLEAIRLAEQSIDPVDLYRQGKPRPDAHTFALGQRLDEDFSTIRPVVDHRPDKGAPPVVADVPFPRRIPLLKEGEFVVDSDKWDAMSEEERKKFKEEKARVLEERAQARAKADEAAAEAESAARTEAWFKSLDPPGGFGYDSVDDIPWKDREALLGKHAPTRLDTMKFLLGDLLFNPDDQSAPALPDRVPGVGGPADLALSTASEGGGSAPAAEADEDEERIYRDVCRQTGLTTREIKSLIMKDLVVRIVSNQTRIGKVRSRYVLAVVGNGNGWLGIGEARGEIANFAGTRTKARIAAIKNMRPILRYERRTIYGNVEGKVGASVVKLFTRPPGFGLRVSSRIFEMCRAAGISDLSARMPRSRNPMNSVKATFEALLSQKNPEDVAIGRGKKMVDVRKVYYGGVVH